MSVVPQAVIRSDENYLRMPIKHRKFHDSWAAFLFIIGVVFLNSLLAIFFLPKLKSVFDFGQIFKEQFTGLNISYVALTLIVSAGIFLFASISLLSFCMVMPKVVIWGSFVINIIACLLPLLFGHIVGIISSIIGVAFTVYIFVKYVYPHIDYIAAVLSVACKILMEHIFGIISTFIVIFGLLSIQISFILGLILATAGIGSSSAEMLGSNMDEKHATIINTIFSIFTLFIYCWIMVTVNYFIEVFISSIIFCHITNKANIASTGHSQSVSGMALKCALYAFGSICYGSLIIAIIKTCRVLVDNETNRRNDRRRRSAQDIIMLIVSCILSVLLSIVEVVNNCVFPYIAVHGTGYRESMSLAFTKLSENNYRGISANNACGWIISIIDIMVCIPSMIVPTIALLQSENRMVIALCFMISILFVFMFFHFASTINSAILALVYCNVEFPQQLHTYNPHLSDVISCKAQMYTY